MFMVSNVSDPSTSYLEEIAQGSVRMGQMEWCHKKIGVYFNPLFCTDFTEFYLCPKDCIHPYWEIWSLHLSCENLRKAELVFPFSVNSKLVFRCTSRDEKRETLNVIPVHVRQKNASVDTLQVVSFHQILAQLTNTRASIQYNDMILSFDADTGGVSSENDGMQPRGSYRSTDSPKSDKDI